MISVIVCTYNRGTYIFNTLESISLGVYPIDQYEILLIDNNSTDNTVSEYNRFSEKYPGVHSKLIYETNQGLSHARNRGIKESNGDLIVFLDDDVVVNRDYLLNLSHYFEKYPHTMAFGGRITPLFESGAAPKWLCRWTYSWFSAIDLGDSVKHFKKKEYPIGANMGFRKECLDKCGWFCTKLGRTKKELIGGEEKDLFERIKTAGYDILYFPEVRLQHIIPESRTTDRYIASYGYGIGKSELIRTSSISKSCYLKRFVSEIIKWCATIVLWFRYLLVFKPATGNKLILFRWNVSKGLLGCQK